MPEDTLPARLSAIARRVHEQAAQPTEAVRTLLRWFGAKRRSAGVVGTVRTALREAELRTVPDFESVHLDADVCFVPVRGGASEPAAAGNGQDAAEPAPGTADEALADPTFRIGRLAAANSAPVSVAPDAPLAAATTLMMMHDYSQLPVMQGDRNVKGVVGWEAIGRRRALGREFTLVRECMESPAPEVPAESSLFAAINLIVRHGFVLVRQRDNRISGIVTTSDVSFQFRQLAEPFLLVGEIENYLRTLIGGAFNAEQLRAARDPGDERPIRGAADLSFGEYVRLLENPKHWDRLGLEIDRSTFVENLDEVRELRNDVMHFDPDPVADEDLRTLRSFVKFLRSLVAHAG